MGLLEATARTLRVGLLGPVTSERDGRLLPLGGPKQRAVLAVLALQPGRVVPVDALLSGVWGDEAAVGATKTLQVYVANLRRTLEVDRAPGTTPTVLVTREPGYVLEIEPDAVDAVRFERAFNRARDLAAGGHLRDAARCVRAALDDWRGRPLAGLEALPIYDQAVPQLLGLRLDALELCCEAELDLGFAGPLVPELESLIVEAPYRERLRALLVRALYASGRQHDALQAFQDARRTLLQDLGVEPGPELQELEHRVLEHDPALDVAPAEGSPPASDPLGAIIRKRISIVATHGPELDHRRLSTAASEHGGTVIERSADVFATAFGVPRLGLDDVDRAAAFALVLARRGLSVGLATGWGAAAGTTVSGAPISRAKELAQAGSPGRALIDAASRDLLAGRATAAPAADGASTLVELTPLPPDATDAGPFVGRDAELELLTSVWRTAARSARPAMVTLVGDPGVGTSRLAAELAGRVQAPLRRIDLDLTVDPAALLDHLSAGPAGSIVLIKHVHRAAPAASWAVWRWLEAPPEGTVLCIATAAPELRSTTPGWPGAIPLALTLDVPPLDEDATRRLAVHLLGDEVAGSRVAAVAAIAGGNPLFLRELVQHVATVDEGAALPDRLGTLLATRVEQLSPPGRGLLESLAVTGAAAAEVERLDARSADVTGALDDLVALGLVRVADDGEVTVPEVVADVVFAAMADDRAVSLHQRAAEIAPTLSARAAHLERAARRAVDGAALSAASAAVDALAELAWRTWSRGDVESTVDALHRAIVVAGRAPVDLISSVRAARRRLASSAVAGRMGTPNIDLPLRASVGAWDTSRPVERELAEAATALGATTPQARQRDQCQAVVTALSAGVDQGRSASSPA